MDKNKISKTILFICVIWIVFNGLINRYISTMLLFVATMATIVLLTDFVEFIKKYRNRILLVLAVIHCSLTGFCIFQFGTYDYVNLASAYVNVVVLETKDYQMVEKPSHSKEYIEDINAPYIVRRRRGVSHVYCYVIKNEGTIDDKMATISNFIYTIEKYELSHGNTYSLYLKVGETSGVLHVTVNDYSQFTIVKFG